MVNADKAIDGIVRIQIRLKRLVDLIAASILVVVLALPGLLLAALIKLEDGGPVFFRQERLGLNAKEFRIWKLRTMVVNADQLLGPDGSANAHRLTKIGKRLRVTGLDELPQLINILAGHMSLIGPRPVLPEHLARYTEEQKGRFAMRPGITGLAQIRGRNTLKWTKRIEADLEYIKRYSLVLDLWILIKTIPVVIGRRGIVLDRNPGQVDDLGNRA